MAPPLSGADLLDLKTLLFELAEDRLGLGLRANFNFFPIDPEEPGAKLRGLACGQEGLNGPILLRHKGANLALAIDDQSERHGLDPARAQPPPDLFPEEGAHLVSHQTIKDPACLLGLYLFQVKGARMRKGLLNCPFGHLVKDHAMHGPLRRLQLLDEVPPDGLPFPIRIGSQVDPLGAPGGLPELLQDFLPSLHHLVLGLEVPLGIDRKAIRREIADVAVRGLDHILFPQKFVDGLGLGRRFHNDQRFRHASYSSFE